jgi:hypothetical protein
LRLSRPFYFTAQFYLGTTLGVQMRERMNPSSPFK